MRKSLRAAQRGAAARLQTSDYTPPNPREPLETPHKPYRTRMRLWIPIIIGEILSVNIAGQLSHNKQEAMRPGAVHCGRD